MHLGDKSYEYVMCTLTIFYFFSKDYINSQTTMLSIKRVVPIRAAVAIINLPAPP